MDFPRIVLYLLLLLGRLVTKSSIEDILNIVIYHIGFRKICGKNLTRISVKIYSKPDIEGGTYVEASLSYSQRQAAASAEQVSRAD